ncbi:MAG: EamA family transporter [Myxococcales bacterium]|nr:EamA family transporter [Myxococcales bacterium]
MADRHGGVLFGLGSAILFGLGAPVSKLLLPDAGPLPLAGLLYLGGGTAFLFVRRSRTEAPLSKADAPILAGAVLAGAALAPPLMLWGLTRVSGLTGSLLLNLEAPFTMALAMAVFGEHLSMKEGVAAALIVAGGAIVGAHGSQGGLAGAALGVLAIAAACLCWAIDNNFNARLSMKDPVQLLRIKMLCAGALNLAAAAIFGQRVHGARVGVEALLLGSLSYGMSFYLYTRAQRVLGAARQGALFAVAPFAGAAVAIPLLGDRASFTDVAGAAVMAAGVLVLARARHAHLHTHAEVTHDHLHVHDAHHQHAHEAVAEPEPHSHLHTHGPLTHEHPHVSDAHHKHRH